MKIAIKLSPDTMLPVWMLGAPRPAPKVLLSLEQPGPVTVDFGTLAEEEQRHILLGVQRGHLEVDMDFESLLAQHNKSYPAEPPAPPEVKTYIEKVEKKKEERVAMNEYQKQVKKDEKREDRCKSIVKMTIKAIKSVVANIDDIKTLRRLHEMENAKPKKRQAVLDLLETKIRKFEMSVEDALIRSANTPPMVDPYNPYANIELVVTDEGPTDQELAEFAAR